MLCAFDKHRDHRVHWPPKHLNESGMVAIDIIHGVYLPLAQLVGCLPQPSVVLPDHCLTCEQLRPDNTEGLQTLDAIDYQDSIFCDRLLPHFASHLYLSNSRSAASRFCSLRCIFSDTCHLAHCFHQVGGNGTALSRVSAKRGRKRPIFTIVAVSLACLRIASRTAL